MHCRYCFRQHFDYATSQKGFASHNFQHSIVVKGPTPLIAKDITIPDLRAGFAYVLAALLAPEISQISELHYLDRGYEQIVVKLAALEADVSRSLPAETAGQKSSSLQEMITRPKKKPLIPLLKNNFTFIELGGSTQLPLTLFDHFPLQIRSYRKSPKIF